MNPEEVVVIRKNTGVEWAAKTRGVSVEEILEDEKHLGLDTDIVDGHFRQIEAVNTFIDRYFVPLGNPTLFIGTEIDQKVVDKSKFVISMGGDNSSQQVSRLIDRQLVLGVNIDTVKSWAAFAGFNVDNFGEFLPKLIKGDFDIQEWIRLQTTVKGKLLPQLAISQVSIRANDPDDMNRYEAAIGQQEDVIKCSGILVATKYGMGKGSWGRNATQYLKAQPEKYDLNINSEQALYAAREGDLDDDVRLSEKLNKGDMLQVIWLAHADGGVKADAIANEPIHATFTRGDSIVVEISDRPLRVVVPKKH